MTIHKEAVQAVLSRRNAYIEAQDYYNGDIPETFSTARLRRAFRATGGRSSFNYCRPIVDAVNDRLEIGTISATTKGNTEKIAKVWSDNDLGLEAKDIHREALVNGDAFVVVWPNGEGYDIALQDSENFALVYDVEDPRKKAYGVKVWKTSDDKTRMTIYGADKITKWSAQTDSITDGTNWSFVESVDNPWGVVPVFHFRTHRPFGRPEHYDAYDGQNAINKLMVTHMETVDYQGAPQRYALAAAGADGGEAEDFAEGDTQRENASALKSGPGELWFMKGVQSMGEFKPADPAVFWTPIEKTVNTIAAITNTPLHFFAAIGNAPSGNGLRTAEAPLQKKVKDRRESFGYTWREMFRFILEVEGITSEVMVYWTPVESLDELERWDVAAKKINAGLSHRQALLEGGYTPEEVDRIMLERQAEYEAGLFYQRAPQTRVNTNADETQAIEVQA